MDADAPSRKRRAAAGTSTLLILVAGCGGPGPSTQASVAPPGDAPSAEAWVERTLEGLTLRQAVAQLVVQWIPGGYAAPSSPAFEPLDEMVDEGLGGLYLSIGAPHAFAAKVNALQRRALDGAAGVPLLFTSDFESGGPGMRLSGQYALPSLLPQGGGTQLPPTMAFGAIGDERFAYEYGRITAAEALAVGVPLNFAPVLDVNSNPDNPVINTRSFGGEPGLVARLGAAYVRGAAAAGGQTTAKHFPGHGDTDVDSHLGLPVIDRDLAALERVELVPFRAAIAAGVDGVMTAHVALPRIIGDGATAARASARPAPGAEVLPPATLAPEILTDLLRDELGFDGLVATDALTMDAVSDTWGTGESAVLALQAGADMILFPGDYEAAIDGVVAAVLEGRISEERVRASTRRMLEAKARAGLHRDPFVDLDAVTQRVGTGPHLAFADTAASRSITLVRDLRGAVPLVAPSDTATILSVTYARGHDLVAGRELDREMRSGAGRVVSVRVGPGSPPEAWREATAGLGTSDAVVVGLYLPASVGTGEDVLTAGLRSFLREAGSTRPTVVVSLGNPYLLDALTGVRAYMLAWAGTEVAQRATARALVGREAVTGRLPIELPPYPIGHGIDVRPGRTVAVDRPVGPEPPRGVLGEPLPGTPVPGPPSPGGATGRTLLPMTVSPVEAPAASVAMDPRALRALDSLLLAAVADSVTPGAALAVGRRGRLVRLRGYGTLDWDGRTSVTPTTLYDLASLTKVVGTTTAVMILEEEGRLDLDAPVVRYLPWWSGGQPDKERVTVRELLLHRSGLPPFRRWFLEMEGREAYRRAIAAEPLEHPPGEATVYSDIGVMSLAFVVEAVSGQRLDAFLERRVWGPLGMGDTGFLPDPSLLGRIAPTEVDTLWRGVHVRGVVHDENADAIGGVAGHAGLFSTAWDLSIFARVMLNGGALPPCQPEVASGVPCARPRGDPARVV
ncbi:MAG: glycoside hydrolase family 3 N-terminal domain-containing protein, partial [Gemmatimonadota bacterium]